jgi:large subunit ribosomal protein L4
MSSVEQVEREVVELLTVERRSADGSILGRVSLDPAIFGVTPHVPVMHQVVTAQLAARRAGTQSTKTRAEVSGGGTKPFRQKGTGRARQGSTRAPHWSGGGVALGPKPRSYKQRTPKKMVQLALKGALSDRAMEGRVCVIDEWGFPVPKTKEAVAALRALDVSGRILIVLEHGDVMAERSFDNLPYVDLVENIQLTAYDVLCSDWVIFNDSTLPGVTTTVEVFDPPLPPPVREEAPKSSASPAREEALESSASPAKTADSSEDSSASAAEVDVEDLVEVADTDEADAGVEALEAAAGDAAEAVLASGTAPAGDSEPAETDAAGEDEEGEA